MATTRKSTRSAARGENANDSPRFNPDTQPTVRKRFNIDAVMRTLRKAVKPYTPAAMFQLKDEGFGSVFEQLVACIISIRTLEEVTLPTARRLFAAARTPAAVSRLSVNEIDRLINTCTFHEPKAKTIRNIAVTTVERFGGELPADFSALTEFNGVGPKCANLAIGVATGDPHGVPVDIHVHRVTNRWGYVHASTPELTMVALESKLPRKYWMEINRLLVPFGKFVCTGKLPKCSTCPLKSVCARAGVTSSR